MTWLAVGHGLASPALAKKTHLLTLSLRYLSPYTRTGTDKMRRVVASLIRSGTTSSHGSHSGMRLAASSLPR